MKANTFEWVRSGIVGLAFVAALCGVAGAQEEPPVVEEPALAAEEPVATETTSDFDLFQEHPFQFRIGPGATVGPERFLIFAVAEMHADRFLSFGPMFQYGIEGGNGIFAPSFGGRLSVPIPELKRFEVSLQTGIGFIVRYDQDLTRTNFLYEANLNVDYFITEQITVGVGGIINLTSADADRYFGSLFAAVSYRL